jgi:hypothetical protein
MVMHRAGRVGLVALAVVALASLATAAVPDAMASGTSRSYAVSYHFRTLDDHGLTINELAGINNNLVIAGFFSPSATRPAGKAYLLFPPRYDQQDYRELDFPGSTETQVFGLNDHGVYVGTAIGQVGYLGWYAKNGVYHEANFPARNLPPRGSRGDELFGVNNHDVAVGFYLDGSYNSHGYEYDIGTNRFAIVTEPGATGLLAEAINNRGDVVGFYYTSQNHSLAVGFIRYSNGTSVDLRAPGACSTWAFGVNDTDEVVGTYTPCGQSTTVMDGFTWTPQAGFTTVNDPNGVGTTVIDGVNDEGDLVGYYTTDHGKITNGMLATP